jgi:hypothetical protein
MSDLLGHAGGPSISDVVTNNDLPNAMAMAVTPAAVEAGTDMATLRDNDFSAAATRNARKTRGASSRSFFICALQTVGLELTEH